MKATILALCVIPFVTANLRLATLGNVDEKEFYLLNPGYRFNWYEALEHCSDTGGKLGSIQSQAQFELLKYKFNEVVSNQMPNRINCAGFWTAGREPAIKPFEWKYDNQTVVPFYTKYPISEIIVGSKHTRMLCLRANIFSDGGRYFVEKCTDEFPCVLCQKQTQIAS